MTAVNEAEREKAAMRQVRERLALSDEYAAAEVGAAVDRVSAYFANARIREFVPLLVERLVRTELNSGVDRKAPNAGRFMSSGS